MAVVARHLAKIERRIEEIVIHQKILLENLAPSLKTHIEPLPAEIKLPCDKEDDVTNIEQWLDSSPENEKKLVSIVPTCCILLHILVFVPFFCD